MKWQQALIPLFLTASAATARATPAPGAARITLDGQTRVVRTLGQPADVEFYAPITRPLRSLWLDVRSSRSDEVEIRYQGSRVARWPVVTRAEDLPTDSSRPAALRQGDDLFVPVKAIVALGNGMVDWDERSRTVTITPTVQRIELHDGDQGLEVRVEASAPVRVTSVQLASPHRLVVDVTPAWFKLPDAPRPAGTVKAVRLGQFTKQTARMVLELAAGPVRVSGLPYAGTTITARLQPGGEVRIARATEPSPSLDGTQPGTVDADAGQPAEPGRSVTQQPAPDNVRKGIGATSARSALTRRGRRLSVLPKRGNLTTRGGVDLRDRSALLEGGGGVLAGKVICVDAGHGGWKSGAQGQNGLQEGTACLAMALQLARFLREAGATVIMPREDDRYVSLEDRYTFANLKRADLFISIHCNAMERHGSMSGSETYYCTPQSLDLARAIHPHVVQAMAGRDGGIRRRNFAVIRHSTMPSILIEVGYIDHPGDEAKLGDPGFQEQFGEAVRDGVIGYYGG